MLNDYAVKLRQKFIKKQLKRSIGVKSQTLLLRLCGLYFMYKILSVGVCYAVGVYK